MPPTDDTETKEDINVTTVAAVSATTPASPTTDFAVMQHLVSFNISMPSSQDKNPSEAQKAAMMRDVAVTLRVASIHCCVLGRFLTDVARFFLGGELMLAVKTLAPALDALVGVHFVR